MMRFLRKTTRFIVLTTLVLTAVALTAAAWLVQPVFPFTNMPKSDLGGIALCDYLSAELKREWRPNDYSVTPEAEAVIRSIPDHFAFSDGYVAIRLKLHTNDQLTLPPWSKFGRFALRKAEYRNVCVWQVKAQLNPPEGNNYLIIYGLMTPVWIPVLLLLAYPALAFVRGPLRRFRRRRKQGLCITCGYNLTGNTTGICPECGQNFDRPKIGLQ